MGQPNTKSDDNAIWRQFPAMEKLGDPRHCEAVMTRIDATCRALETIRTGGTPAERDRAQFALAAYARTLQLIEEIQAKAAETATDAGRGR
ncbi:MAG: hypothetical protein R2762_28965 [Bryobacteraceae bacterium]